MIITRFRPLLSFSCEEPSNGNAAHSLEFWRARLGNVLKWYIGPVTSLTIPLLYRDLELGLDVLQGKQKY